MNIKGEFSIQHYRGNALMNERRVHNQIKLAAKQQALDIIFGSTAKHNWYCGLMKRYNDYSTEYPYATDALTAMSDIYTWDFANVTRQQISFAAAEQIPETDDATVTQETDNYIMFRVLALGGSLQLGGTYICSTYTGISGLLWCTAAYTPFSVTDNDYIKCKYTITLA